MVLCQITSAFKQVVKIESSNDFGVIVGRPYSQELDFATKSVLGTIDTKREH